MARITQGLGTSSGNHQPRRARGRKAWALASAVAGVGLLLASNAPAATVNWTGNAADHTNWNSTANWSPAAPAVSSPYDDVVFDAALMNALGYTTTVNVAASVNSMTFSGAAANDILIKGTGTILALDGFGDVLANNIASGPAVTIGQPIGTALTLVLDQAAATIRNEGVLNINANVVAKGYTIGFSGAGTTTLGANAALSGDGGTALTLNKSGTGTLAILNNNNYNNLGYGVQVILDQGELSIADASVIGGDKLTSLNMGNVGNARLTLTGLPGAANGAQDLVLYGLGPTTSTIDVQNSAATFYLNRVSLGVIQGGPGAGATALVKEGAGTLVLQNDNTFNGNLLVNGGTLQLQNPTALGYGTNSVTVDNGATLRLADIVDPSTGEHLGYDPGHVRGAGDTTGKAGDYNDAINGVSSNRKFIVGPGGANWDIQAAFFQVNDAGQLAGSGTLTITGPNPNPNLQGVVLLEQDFSTSFTGNLVIGNGGWVRLSNANGAGLQPITINANGKLSNNAGGAVANTINLAGGTLGSGGSDRVYSGAVNLSAGLAFDSLDADRALYLSSNPTTGAAVDRTTTLSGVVTDNGNTVTIGSSSGAGNVTKGLLLTNPANVITGQWNIQSGGVLQNAYNGGVPSIPVANITQQTLGLTTGPGAIYGVRSDSDLDLTGAGQLPAVTGGGNYGYYVGPLAGTTAPTVTIPMQTLGSGVQFTVASESGGTVTPTNGVNSLTLQGQATLNVAGGTLRIEQPIVQNSPSSELKISGNSTGRVMFTGPTTNYSFQNLNIAGGSTVVDSNHTLHASLLNFSGGNINLLGGGAGGTLTINASDTVQALTGSSSITAIGGGMPAGGVSFAGGTPTINVDGAGSKLAISANIGDGGASYGINKTGTGELKLSGVNTLGGQLVVNQGVLNIASTSAAAGTGLGANKTILLNNDGTLKMSGSEQVAGLLEGRLTGTTGMDSTTPNPGNFGARLNVRMAERFDAVANPSSNDPNVAWNNNETWVYTGQYYDADGVFAIASYIDDRTWVSVDGKAVMYNNSGWANITSSGSRDGLTNAGVTAVNANSAPYAGTTDFGMGLNNDGWHTIEIRVQNGTGGAGSGAGNVVAYNWTTGYGLGISEGLPTNLFDGSSYVNATDPGDGSVFRTTVSGLGLDLSDHDVDAAGSNAGIDLTESNVGMTSRVGTLTLHAGNTTHIIGAGRTLAAATTSLRGDGSSIVLAGDGELLIGRIEDGDGSAAQGQSPITLTISNTNSVTLANIDAGNPNDLNRTTISVQGDGRLTGLGADVGADPLAGLTVNIDGYNGILKLASQTAGDAQPFGAKLVLNSQGILEHSTGTSETLGVTGADTVVELNGNQLTGNATSGTVTVNGRINDSGFGGKVVKTGAGAMVLGGTTTNTFAGQSEVQGGTLLLNKPDGVQAIASVNVVSGTLKNLANDQINGDLTMNGGTYDLNGQSEFVNSVVFYDGQIIDSAGAGTGKLVTPALTKNSINSNDSLISARLVAGKDIAGTPVDAGTAWAISSGKLVLTNTGAAATANDLTNTRLDVNFGATIQARGDNDPANLGALNNATVRLAGGTFQVGVAQPGFDARLYAVRDQIQAADFPVLNSTPVATVNPFTAPLTFANDAAFAAAFNNATPTTNDTIFSAVFMSNFFAPVTGDYQFASTNNDDTAVVWIDLNQNGIFETANNEKVQQVALGNSSSVTVHLEGGQQYKVAYGLEDTGGGSRLTAQWANPNGSLATVDVSQTFVPNQFYVNPLDTEYLTTTNVELQDFGMGTVEAVALKSYLGNLSIAPGSQLTVSGQGRSVDFASTVFQNTGSGSTISLKADANLALGQIVDTAGGGAPAGGWTLTNTGVGVLTLNGTETANDLSHTDLVLNLMNTIAEADGSSLPGAFDPLGNIRSIQLKADGTIFRVGNKDLTGTATASGDVLVDPGFGAVGSIQHAGLTSDVFNGNTITLQSGTLRLGGTGTLTLGHKLTGTGNLEKAGGGVMVLGGMTANDYTGTTRVLGGTLVLAKPDGVRAINNPTVSGVNAVLQLGANEQIVDAPRIVTIDNSGTFDTNGYTQTLESLLLGENARVTNSLPESGSLKMNGGVTYSGMTFGATITAGTIDLLGAQRTFQVNDGLGAVDLVVGATLTNGGVVKNGAGRVEFSGDKGSITGDVLINEGQVALLGNEPLGTSKIVMAPGTSMVLGKPLYEAGLQEGRITGTGAINTLSANPGNSPIQLTPRLGETNAVTNDPNTGWSSNETWVYTGQFFDADGTFAFAKSIDDAVWVKIDGQVVLSNGSYTTTCSTATRDGASNATPPVTVTDANPFGGTTYFGMGPNLDGWHDIEIRFQNGTGGAGPVAANGFTTTYGFGLSKDYPYDALNGAAYVIPQDPGDATLFRTQVGNVTFSGSSNDVIANGDGISIDIQGQDLASVTPMGRLTRLANTSLEVIGAGRTIAFSGTEFIGGADNSTSNIDFTGSGNIGLGEVTDGARTDASAPRYTLRNLGTGNIVLDNYATPNDLDHTTIEIQSGGLGVVGSGQPGTFDPLGGATVKFTGDNTRLTLSSVAGPNAVVFPDDVKFDLNGTIEHTGGNVDQLGSASGANQIGMNDGKALTFNIVAGTLKVDSKIVGQGSGAFDVVKNNQGTLVLEGPTSNTFSGTLTSNAGTLVLNKSAGATAARSLIVNGGLVRWGGNEQLADAGSLLVNGGSLDLGGFTETISHFDADGGGVGTVANGSLVITSPSITKTGSSASGVTVSAKLTTPANTSVNVTGGVLRFANSSAENPNAFGAGTTFSASNGGTLGVVTSAGGSNPLTVSTPITLNSGTLDLSGGGTYLAGGLKAEYFSQTQMNALQYQGGGVGNAAWDFTNQAGIDASFATPYATVLSTNVLFNSVSGNSFMENPVSPVNYGRGVDQLARFTGQVKADVDGTYTFFGNSDDATMVFIDGQQVVFNNNYQGNSERNGTITLTAGMHDIAVYYMQGGGGGNAGMSMQTPAGVKQVIDGTTLYADGAAIPNPVTATGDSTINLATTGSVGPLTVSGTLRVTGGALMQNTQTTLAGNTTLFDNGQVWLDGVGQSTASSLTKDGLGTLVFAGPNSYTGGTTILNGAIRVIDGSAMPPSAPAIRMGGALQIAYPGADLSAIGMDYGGKLSIMTPQVTADGAVAPSSPIKGTLEFVNLNVAAGEYDGVQMAGHSTLRVSTVNQDRTLSNNIVLAGNAGNASANQQTSFVQGGTNLFTNIVTYNGTISGSGGLSWMQNEGRFQGNLTYTGATNIEGGTFKLSNGNGKLTNVNAVVNVFGGTFLIDNTLGGNNTDRLNDATSVVNMLGGTFNHQGVNNAASNETVGTVVVGAGGVAANNGGSTTNTTTLTITNLDTASVGGQVNFSGIGATPNNNRIRILNVNGSPAVADSTKLISGGLRVNNADFAALDANLNVVALTGVATGSEANAIAGITNATGATNFKVTNTAARTIAFQSGDTANSLNLSNTAANNGLLILDQGTNSVKFTSGAIMFTGSSQVRIQTNPTSDGAVTMTSGTNHFDITNLTGQQVEFQTKFTGDNVSMMIVGTGSTRLSNRTNDFLGGVTVAGGILTGWCNNGAKTGDTLGVKNGVYNPITLIAGTLNIRDNGSGSNSQVDYLHPITIKSNSTIDLNRIDGSNTGITIRFGDLSFDSGRTLLLSGGNAFRGQFQNVNMANDATFSINAGMLSEITGSITAPADSYLTKAGPGILSLTGDSSSTFHGTVVVSGGSLQMLSPTAMGSSPILIAQGGMYGLGMNYQAIPSNVQFLSGGGLSLMADQNVSYGSTLPGTAVGVLEVGVNVGDGYDGVRIAPTGNAFGYGVIRPYNNASVSYASDLAVLGATQVDSGTGTFTLSGTISGAGRLSKIGSGTLVLAPANAAAPNAYAGGMEIVAGTVNANTAGALSGMTTVLNNATLNLNAVNAAVGDVTAAMGTVNYNATGAMGGHTLTATLTNYNSLSGDDYAHPSQPQSNVSGLITLNNTLPASGDGYGSDQFVVEAGGVISGDTAHLNALNRGLTGTSGLAKNVTLMPGAIVAHQQSAESSILEMGTTPDVFFGLGNSLNLAADLKIGAHTPWEGISTDRSARSFLSGNILIDDGSAGGTQSPTFPQVTLQALNGSSGLTIGNGLNASTANILKADPNGGAVIANVVGRLTLDGGTTAGPTANYSGIDTIVVDGATNMLLVNRDNGLGGVGGSAVPKVIVRNGGIIDMPGINAGNNATGGYFNGGDITLEAGALFWVNDASNLASGVGTDVFKWKTGAVVAAVSGTADNFLNAAGNGFAEQWTSLKNAEPGVIYRVGVSDLKYFDDISRPDGIFEVYQADRSFNAAAGTPGLTLGATDGVGGILTNDTGSRTLNAAAGVQLTLTGPVTIAATDVQYNNAVEGVRNFQTRFAGTGQLTFNMNMPINGGTNPITINAPAGTLVDGLSKQGYVVLGGSSNVAGAVTLAAGSMRLSNSNDDHFAFSGPLTAKSGTALFIDSGYDGSRDDMKAGTLASEIVIEQGVFFQTNVDAQTAQANLTRATTGGQIWNQPIRFSNAGTGPATWYVYEVDVDGRDTYQNVTLDDGVVVNMQTYNIGASNLAAALPGGYGGSDLRLNVTLSGESATFRRTNDFSFQNIKSTLGGATLNLGDAASADGVLSTSIMGDVDPGMTLNLAKANVRFDKFSAKDSDGVIDGFNLVLRQGVQIGVAVDDIATGGHHTVDFNIPLQAVVDADPNTVDINIQGVGEVDSGGGKGPNGGFARFNDVRVPDTGRVQLSTSGNNAQTVASLTLQGPTASVYQNSTGGRDFLGNLDSTNPGGSVLTVTQSDTDKQIRLIGTVNGPVDIVNVGPGTFTVDTADAANNFDIGTGDLNGHTVTNDGPQATLRLNAPTNGKVVYNNGTVQVNSDLKLTGLEINAAATMSMNGHDLMVGRNDGVNAERGIVSINTANGSTLDLVNGVMIVQSDAANASSDLAAVTSLVVSGFDGYLWDGQGITSSLASADASAGNFLIGVGVISNNYFDFPVYTNYPETGANAQPVDLNSIIVRATYYGDANLDGVVDGLDYGLVDNGFLSGLSGWLNGDFNYDGVVDGLDYGLIDNSFLSAGSPLAAQLIARHTAQFGAPYTGELAALSGGSQAVPEPGTLSLLALGALGLLSRRRRARA